MGAAVVEVRCKHSSHAVKQAGAGVVEIVVAPGGVRCESGVAEVDLRCLAAAQEPSHDLPDRHELSPGDPVALIVTELAVRDQGVEKPAPLSLRGASPLSPRARETLVRRPVVIDAPWTKLLDGVLVDPLGDVRQVLGTRMRADEEEGRADGS